MTYTAADGTQVPQGTDAFSPAAQFKTWVDNEAFYSNRRIYATTAARDAETFMSQGWKCYILADGSQWLYTGSAWVVAAESNATGALGLTGAFSATSGYTPKLEKNGNIVTLGFAITNSATTPTGIINTGTAIATLPAGFRPTANPVTPFTGMNNSGSVLISYTIDTSGVIRAYPLSALGAGATLYGSTAFSVV